jgi:cytochrome c-type biogenesis protein CcmH
VRRWFLYLVLALVLAPGLAHAVLPDEVLPNPVLEARARALSSELRCLVCQNQSIDDSGAQLARDLRLLVRERLVAGDSDQQVRDYLVARYGDFVLLKPPFRLDTALLWGMPFLVLGLGALGLFLARQRSAAASVTAPLSEAEQVRLAKLLEQDRL